jgi:hypothetical protein
MATSSKAKTAKEYLLNPDKDPIKAASALAGKYRGSNFISAIDAVVRGTFSLSTSIIKGTFNFTTTIAKNINTQARVTERIKNVTSTLIGTENTDNAINFVDQARAELFKGYEAAAKNIAQAATGDSTSNYKDIILQGSSKVIKNMKIAANAATGVNFDVRDMIKNSIVIDIETGGLFKDAPIIQLAMTEASNMEDVKKMTAKEIASMNPREQIAKGFLEMNLLPEAIIRDTSGENKTFKMFGYMPRSADEFGKVFGTWAVEKDANGKSKFKLHEFYEEMADEVMADGSKRISDARYAEIMQKAKAQGFIELANGQRFYSQREAAKWSMYFSKLGAKENKSLIAANLSFESFRVGKLWNYFMKDTVGPATGTDKVTNLQLNPSEVDFLNEDEDLLRAFGKDATSGEITGHREVREMLMASWKSKYKLNILDENNYYFVDKFNKMRDLGESNQMIGLFPEWMKRTGKGLKTADQLQLTKMLFSGLMQTGFSPLGNDVFSGTKIDFATRVVLGEVEAHTALSDVFHQTELLTKGKLGDLVGDVYNIFKAQESSSMGDQIKSFFSAARILTDNKKKAWFDLDTIFRQTQISVADPRLEVMDNGVSKALMYHGTANEISKQFNVDKELMRISETVDAWTGIDESIFSEKNLESASILKEVEYEDGTKEMKRFYTSGKEPFSMGQKSGKSRHEMLTQDGTSLHVGYTQHDYDLQKKVKDRFAELTSGGMDADDARKHVKNWLAEEYAETPGMKGTGRTVSDVTGRLNQIMQMLPGGELGKELNKRMSGQTLDSRIMEQLKDRIDKAAEMANSEFNASGKFFSDMGAGVKDILKGNRRISDITLDSIKNLPESFVAKTFNVDSKLAAYAVKAGGKVAGLGMAAIGVGAGLGLGYMVDAPSWKKTTGEILRMTGEEREVLPEGHYKKGGTLSQVTESFTGPVDQTNPDGIALRAIDESKVDYAVGDGDTIQILSKGFMGLGRKSLGSVRIAGIDTPEVAHGGGGGGPGDMPFSQPGKNYLTNVLSARTGATVAIGSRETYGRAVGVVTDKEGINYSYQMIQQGFGSALYRERRSEDLMNQSAFNAAENVARKSEKGMWAQPFYYGAQANIDPRDRKGWNKMTPDNMAQFRLDRSPGSSQEQSLAQLSEMQHMDPSRAINTIGDTVFANSMQQMDKAHLQKSSMAEMQQMALMNSMQRNRGRGKDRR